MLFDNTSILVFKKDSTGTPVLISIFCSMTVLMRKS